MDLNEEDKKFLEYLENNSKERYTVNDVEFMKHVSKETPKVPIVRFETFESHHFVNRSADRRHHSDRNFRYNNNNKSKMNFEEDGQHRYSKRPYHDRK